MASLKNDPLYQRANSIAARIRAEAKEDPAVRYGVFWINGRARAARYDAERYDAFEEAHPDSLLGVYDRDAKTRDIYDDIAFVQQQEGATA